ncbi:ferritin-like domain-containing protein [Sphaerisporangium sp. NBC_01403]|uniref:DUF892 family protein n=1 Tax=Sphaerisporangium sp. NBC_01403 TaxID=2903599 RepID=UPI0032511AC7
MAFNNPSDLFLYELSAVYDGEIKITKTKEEMAGQVRSSSLAEELRNQVAKGQEKVRNLDACFRSLGTAPLDVPCLVVDAMRAEFQQFIQRGPAPEVIDMYTVGAELKLASYKTAGYKCLVDKAVLMGQSECAHFLQTNLVGEEEAKGHFERLSHEVSEATLAGV